MPGLGGASASSRARSHQFIQGRCTASCQQRLQAHLDGGRCREGRCEAFVCCASGGGCRQRRRLRQPKGEEAALLRHRPRQFNTSRALNMAASVRGSPVRSFSATRAADRGVAQRLKPSAWRPRGDDEPGSRATLTHATCGSPAPFSACRSRSAASSTWEPHAEGF